MIDVASIVAKFKKVPERLGIDVCSGGIKVVRLNRVTERAFELTGRGFIDVDITKATPLEMQRARAMVQQVGGGLRNAALSIEHPTLRVRQMRIAPMPERDMLEAIRWNFREHVEVPMEQYAVGYTPIESADEGEQRVVMAYGVSRKAVEQHTAFAKALGCKVIAVEPVVTAVLAAYDANKDWTEGQYSAALVVDVHQSYFLVMSKGVLLFSRPLAGISFEMLIKLIMRNMALDERPAREEFERWMLGSKGEVDVEEDLDRRQRFTMTIGHFFSQLVIEVQRTIDAFCIMYEADKVDIIHVCGEGARFPGIVEHLKKTLGVNSETFNPFERVKLNDEETPLDSTYATAVGLAIP